MAKVISDDKKIEVKDNSSITQACEELGVVFGCYVGVCHSCKIKILEGIKNLSELTDPEKEAGLEKNERLACQCKIKKGSIIIKY